MGFTVTIRGTLRRITCYQHWLGYQLLPAEWLLLLLPCASFMNDCVLVPQTTTLDKEKQIFRRRRHHDVKPQKAHSAAAGAAALHSANLGLAPAAADLTPEPDDE